MKSRLFLLISILLAFSYQPTFGKVKSNAKSGNKKDYYVCAYIWPSCHNDELGEKLVWHDGRGEWEIIEKCTPRFEGHYQPKHPLWEGDMDNDPAVVEKWIRTALKYGVNTFIYDWYWFNHQSFLESALDDGFLKAPSNRKMNFYIMYANHKVTNLWNPYENEEKKLLFDPKIDWNDWKTIVQRVIDNYFKLPNYIKIDGCPVFSLWDMGIFTESFGSIEEAGKAIDYFRKKVIEAGFPDLHLQLCGGFWKRSPEEIEVMKTQIKVFGVNSTAAYNMGGFNNDYIVHGMKGIELREEWEKTFGLTTFPTVSVGWDSAPRLLTDGIKEVTYYNHTPEAFASFIQTAKEYSDKRAGKQPKFIMLNAWNEYVEGSYLLPDRREGVRYLEAVRDVLDGKYEKR